MTDAHPKMMGADDIAEVMEEGADAMAMMILQSLTQGEMPPPDLFRWYTRYATVRFIKEEYDILYNDRPSDGDAYVMLNVGLHELLKMVDQNNQFSVRAEIDDLLRVRMLHLPEGYKLTLDRNRLPTVGLKA